MKLPPNDPRQKLISSLTRYQPIDDSDLRQKERILNFVFETPDCFERTHLAGHITGSAWLIDKTGSRVLLTHHRKLNKWLQLGGHADGEADILEVARREAEEESGLTRIEAVSNEIFDVDIHAIPARSTEPAHWHYDIRFAFRATASETIQITNESRDLQWVPLKSIATFNGENSLLRMAAKWDRFPTIL